MTKSRIGIGHWAEICPSHLAKDEELRLMFHPGVPVIYYPETMEIVEGMVLVGVVADDNVDPNMIVVPLAKLKFSEEQFSEILTNYPEIYEHYRNLVSQVLGCGSKRMSHKTIHQSLKAAVLSAQTASVLADVDGGEDLYLYEDER